MKETNLGPQKKNPLITIIIIIAIISLGVLTINQTLGYYYKSALLQDPCSLCKTLNPELDICPIIPPSTKNPLTYDFNLTSNFNGSK